MFITINNVNEKSYYLDPIRNCKKIGLRSITIQVGWYNIEEPQICRWGTINQNSTEFTVAAGLYNFNDLIDVLVENLPGLVIDANKRNGLIDMTIPENKQLLLTEKIRNMLGLEDSGWLSGGYDGDKSIDFSPRRMYIYLNELSTTGNIINSNQNMVLSQLLCCVPISSGSFGEYYTVYFNKPLFKNVRETIENLNFSFELEFSDGTRILNNHSKPISLELEIK